MGGGWGGLGLGGNNDRRYNLHECLPKPSNFDLNGRKSEAAREILRCTAGSRCVCDPCMSSRAETRKGTVSLSPGTKKSL